MQKTQNKWERWLGAYKEINSHRCSRIKGTNKKSFYEKHIHKNTKKKKIHPIEKYFVSIMWVFIPCVLVAFAITGIIGYITAILGVILYHFVAMHYIIMMGWYLKD